jgi:hypothetical protein
LGVSFPAVRSLTLLSLADPLLSVASTSWMLAVQREATAASARFVATQFQHLWGRQAAVRVGRQATRTGHSAAEIEGREAVLAEFTRRAGSA